MKKIRVFKDGVYLRDIYPHATRFQVLKYRVAQFIGNVVRKIIYWTKLAMTAGVAVAVGAFLFGNFTGVSTLVVNAENPNLFAEKIEQQKDALVEEIARLEGPIVEKQGLIIIDDNKSKSLPQKDKVSLGCMQYKVSTVQLHYYTLNKEKLSNEEATLLALNCEKAKDLAKNAIFKIPGSIWAWSVATKEMGAKVELIRSMESSK